MRPGPSALSSLQVRTLVSRAMTVPELAGDDIDLRGRLIHIVETELMTNLPVDLEPGRPAHEFFTQLVHACRRRWGGMHALSDAIHVVSAQCQARDDLRDLLRGMAGQGLVMDAERRELQHILARHRIELTPVQLGDVVCGIRASQVRTPGSLDAALRNLDGAEQDGLPSILILVRHLADIVDDDSAEELRSWLARAEAARPTPATAVIDPWSALDQLHLTIQVVEAGSRVRGATAVEKYRLHATINDSHGTVVMQDQSSGSFVRDDLDSQGEMLLARMIAGSAEHSTRPVRLEFYLPTALFDHPVEQWRIGPPDQAVCIGLEIPTVVRSLDRLTTSPDRERWNRRWNNRNADKPAFWMHQRTDSHGDIEWGPDHIAVETYPKVDDLYRHLHRVMPDQSCAQACCLAPRSESRRHPIDGLGVSVRAGIPIALWCRAAVPPDELAATFADLISEHSADDLPGRVHELRLAGMADWHDDVVVLYDDPNRVVLPSSNIEPFNQLRDANV